MSSTKFRSSEGDWTCPDTECANVNFARRTACNRCGKEKIDLIKSKKQIGVEIGKAAAEKSRGLFSADDWQCTKCGNVNWARRQQCNMCNAPKFGEVEERTGYGGGYNDRGEVEYIERDESDGEYDEFGRKKKKYRKEDGSSQEEEKVMPVNKLVKNKIEIKKDIEKDDEEDDEDDDDDDDEDLSKYDLSGWGDDEEEEEKKKTEKEQKSSNKNDKKESSRSSSSQSSSRSRSSRSRSRSRSRSPKKSISKRSSRRYSRSNSRSRSRSPYYYRK